MDCVAKGVARYTFRVIEFGSVFLQYSFSNNHYKMHFGFFEPVNPLKYTHVCNKGNGFFSIYMHIWKLWEVDRKFLERKFIEAAVTSIFVLKM